MNYISCPICGVLLQRSNLSSAEIKCNNCRSMIKICVKGGIVVVGDSTVESKIFQAIQKEMKIE